MKSSDEIYHMTSKKYYSKNCLYSVLLVGMLSMSACTEQTEDAKAVTSKSHEEKVEHDNARQPSANTGTVKTIHHSGGYSYIEVDINGELFWLAAGISNINPGEIITWNGYAMMPNFTSKSLNRVFEQILFVDRVIPASALATTQHEGTVIESMDSAGYSYIHVNENGKKIWLAAPVIKLDPGQTIQWGSGQPMRNFVSKSLQRNFDEIFFVSQIHI